MSFHAWKLISRFWRMDNTKKMFFKRSKASKHQPLKEEPSSSNDDEHSPQVRNHNNHNHTDNSSEDHSYNQSGLFSSSDELLLSSPSSLLSNRIQSAFKRSSNDDSGSSGNLKEKRKAVSFRDFKSSVSTVNNQQSEEESPSTNINVHTRTEMMRNIDDQEEVIIESNESSNQHDDFDTSPNTVNSLRSEYYMTHSGHQRSARDRHSIDEIAMQPKIIMSRQSIRFLKSVIPKKREERTWRHKLYLIMNQPQSSRLATIVTILVSIVVLISVIVLILESYATLYQYELMWWIIE